MKKPLSILILFIYISIISCQPSQNNYEDNFVPDSTSTTTQLIPSITPSENYSFGYSSEAAIKIFKEQLEHKDPIELAEYIYKNHLFSSYRYDENPTYHLPDIDWDIQYSISPTSYNLGLQTLDMVGILCNAYSINGDLKYLERANELINSWIKYSKNDPQSKYCWYDHSVSSRVLNIIYFLSFMDNKNLENIYNKNNIDKILRTLDQHAEFLYDDNNYYPNNNHGIMSDRALLALALFLPEHNASDIWYEKGNSRLLSQLLNQYTQEGVHVENSPIYGIGVTDGFEKIEKFLNTQGKSLGENLNSIIKKAHTFQAYMVMPNKYLPMIGDTSYITCIDKCKINTQNLSGFAIYPEAGYAVIREDWNSEDSTWIGFKAGYIPGTAHKHNDELSFTLFTKGVDVFIDSGMYNYEYDDPFRQYFLSSFAHNTIIVDSHPFYSTFLKSDKAKILSWESNDIYDQVTATNELYPGVSIDRHLYYLKPNHVVIFDEIISDQYHSYSQLFHLNENINVVPSIDDEFKLKISDKYIVTIRQLNYIDDLFIHKGDQENPGFGIVSRKWNEIINTTTLEYKKSGDNVSFITLITIEDEETPNNDKVILNSDNKSIYFTKDNHEYKVLLNQRVRNIPSGNIDSTYQIKDLKLNIKVEPINSNSIRYEISPLTPGQHQYAWYIYKDGVVVEKYWYSNSGILEKHFDIAGSYDIQIFIQDIETKAKYSKIIDTIFIE